MCALKVESLNLVSHPSPQVQALWDSGKWIQLSGPRLAEPTGPILPIHMEVESPLQEGDISKTKGNAAIVWRLCLFSRDTQSTIFRKGTCAARLIDPCDRAGGTTNTANPPRSIQGLLEMSPES